MTNRCVRALVLIACLSTISPHVSAKDIVYDVEIVGIEDAELLESATAASRLIELKDRPPPSLTGLRRRATGDVDRLIKVARSHAYYSATVGYDIDTEATPVVVKLIAETGPAYLIQSVEVVLRDPAPEAEGMAFDPVELGLPVGAPAESSMIIGAETQLIVALEGRAFPLARTVDRKVVVDHESRSVDVSFFVSTGPTARFGDVSYTGLKDVEETYVRRRLRWERAQPYDAILVERTRQSLVESRLFSSVRISHADAADDEGLLPMAIAVDEAKPRVLGAGVGFSTDEGLGAKVFWEHRNLFGKAERIRLELGGNRVRYGANGEFVRPDFLDRDQSLIVDASLTEERTEAFDSERVATTFSVERPLFELVTGRGGVGFERSFVSEDNVEERFRLVSLPFRFNRDSTDDLLDPTEGSRVGLFLTPYLQPLGSDLDFFVARIRPRAYVLLEEEQRVVLAAWGSAGTILGTNTETLPADKRFYSGGGGSIRGYGFQLVGPLDSANDPVGGRSVLEVGLEVRAKVYGDFGGVAFIEGGNVYDNGSPDLGKELFWGTGLGLRYFTGFGPVRLDIAFPLNRRNDVDDALQLYVSLGQAF